MRYLNYKLRQILLNNTPQYRNSAIIAAIWALVLLLCLALANRYISNSAKEIESITPPVIRQPAIANTEPVNIDQLNLSIDHQIEFSPPPTTFELPADSDNNVNQQSELFGILNQHEQNPVSISGKVMMNDEEEDYLKAVEGLQLEIKIKTE